MWLMGLFLFFQNFYVETSFHVIKGAYTYTRMYI